MNAVGTGAAQRLRFPDFYVIGPQKTSTTWLHEVLSEHPAISRGFIKQPGFLSELFLTRQQQFFRKERLRLLGLAIEQSLGRDPIDQRALDVLAAYGIPSTITHEHYAQLYQGAPGHKLVFDCTPTYYLLNDDGISYLNSLNSTSRVIAILRNPFAHAISWLRYNLSLRIAPADAGRAPEIDPALVDSLVARYAALDPYDLWVPRWQAAIPPERLLFVFFEDLHQTHQRHQTHQGLLEICRFLEIDAVPELFLRADTVIYRTVLDWPIPEPVRQRLLRLSEPALTFLAARFGRHASRWLAEARA